MQVAFGLDEWSGEHFTFIAADEKTLLFMLDSFRMLRPVTSTVRLDAEGNRFDETGAVTVATQMANFPTTLFCA